MLGIRREGYPGRPSPAQAARRWHRRHYGRTQRIPNLDGRPGAAAGTCCTNAPAVSGPPERMPRRAASRRPHAGSRSARPSSRSGARAPGIAATIRPGRPAVRRISLASGV